MLSTLNAIPTAIILLLSSQCCFSAGCGSCAVALGYRGPNDNWVGPEALAQACGSPPTRLVARQSGRRALVLTMPRQRVKKSASFDKRRSRVALNRL
jgi:hypothetical protein